MLARACRDRDVSVEDEIQWCVRCVPVGAQPQEPVRQTEQTIGIGLTRTTEQSGWGITRHRNSKNHGLGDR